MKNNSKRIILNLAGNLSYVFIIALLMYFYIEILKVITWSLIINHQTPSGKTKQIFIAILANLDNISEGDIKYIFPLTFFCLLLIYSFSIDYTSTVKSLVFRQNAIIFFIVIVLSTFFYLFYIPPIFYYFDISKLGATQETIMLYEFTRINIRKYIVLFFSILFSLTIVSLYFLIKKNKEQNRTKSTDQAIE